MTNFEFFIEIYYTRINVYKKYERKYLFRYNIGNIF